MKIHKRLCFRFVLLPVNFSVGRAVSALLLSTYIVSLMFEINSLYEELILDQLSIGKINRNIFC